jgi:hypothetical protein
MSMNQVAREALEKTIIEKWQPLYDALKHKRKWSIDVERILFSLERGAENCVLCKKYLLPLSSSCCHGCPVFLKTGVKGCGFTPYPDVCRAKRKRNLKQLKIAVKAELEFLKSLREE